LDFVSEDIPDFLYNTRRRKMEDMILSKYYFIGLQMAFYITKQILIQKAL